MSAEWIIELIIAILGPLEKLLNHPQAPLTGPHAALRQAVQDYKDAMGRDPNPGKEA